MQDKATQYLAIAKNYVALSFAEIRQGVANVVSGMSKRELKELANMVGATLLSGDTKSQWQEEFARRIVENKASYIRCQFSISC